MMDKTYYLILFGVVLVGVSFAVEYFTCYEQARTQHVCEPTDANMKTCIKLKYEGAILFKECDYCRMCSYNYTLFHDIINTTN